MESIEDDINRTLVEIVLIATVMNNPAPSFTNAALSGGLYSF